MEGPPDPYASVTATPTPPSEFPGTPGTVTRENGRTVIHACDSSSAQGFINADPEKNARSMWCVRVENGAAVDVTKTPEMSGDKVTRLRGGSEVFVECMTPGPDQSADPADGRMYLIVEPKAVAGYAQTESFVNDPSIPPLLEFMERPDFDQRVVGCDRYPSY